MNYGHREDGARQDNKSHTDFEGWGQSGPLTTRVGNGPGSGFGLQKSFGRFARAYTVQFALLTPPNGCDCTADIHFSVAGQTILLRVSVGNAISLTGLCQALNIQLYDTTTVAPFTVITGAVSLGGLIEITDTGHGYSTGNTIFISGVTGTVEANGNWIITVVDANHFTLNGSVFVNAYISGGEAQNVTPQPYAAIVTVTPGTRGSTSLPPTLKGVATATTGTFSQGGVGGQPIPAGGGAVSWNVPQGVGVVSREVSVGEIVSPVENISVNFFDTTGNILIKSFSISTGVYPIFVDIPPNCGVVTVINRDANITVCALTWGIDG